LFDGGEKRADLTKNVHEDGRSGGFLVKGGNYGIYMVLICFLLDVEERKIESIFRVKWS